jgi:hypothetical protein
MKFSFYVLIPAGIALAFFVMQYFTTTEGGSGAGMTREEIEAELSVQTFDVLFELIEDRFPERMKAHRDQTLEIMSDPRLAQAHKGQQVMALNRDFTDTLRRENAALIAQAPEAMLLELQQAELDVLHSVRADPELCTRLAAGGLAALSRFEQAALDQDKMRVMILTQFQAMVAGQDAPTPPRAAGRGRLGAVHQGLDRDRRSGRDSDPRVSGRPDRPARGVLRGRDELLPAIA